jgi:predicted PurR-regulated permease PerM
MLKKINLAMLFFGVIFVITIILNWVLFEPIIHPLIFGAIIAGSFSPVNKKLFSILKNDRLSASITCLIIIIVVVMPCLYVLIQLSKESIEFYNDVKIGLSKESIKTFLFGGGKTAQLISSASNIFGIKTTISELENHVLQMLQALSGSIFNFVNGLFSNIIAFSFNFILMLLTTYALLSDGKKLKEFFLKLSPLPDDQEIMIINKFNQMNYVTLVCNGIGGVIQGSLAAFAFWLTGIENIFLWFVLMVILAFIPLLGISIITIPACIYLGIIGKTSSAIGLFIWSSTVSLIVENWFKPKFIGKRIQLNSTIVLFYIVGGMSVFGMSGIFYGPLICVIFMTMVEIYHENYAS